MQQFIRERLGLSGFYLEVPIVSKIKEVKFPPSFCHVNCEYAKDEFGGSRISCWYVEKNESGFQAVYHSVWKNRGKYIDITPPSFDDVVNGLASTSRYIVLEPRFDFKDPKDAFKVRPVTNYETKMCKVIGNATIDFTELF